ncbi:MAG: alcohol dehydrogenase catalytic domain-containing protein [Verrucomicrobiales bacterium]|nr:alcohol dehydrogenase catalytic domain-containing protein [Verrucomicrobiales bacterium]MCP5527699.1 alcohol dehydrogenase catalytic domain-containing protein [Verrucomicrobiales bacterium]
MRAARLHGPGDLRVETVPHPGAPGPGQALIRVKATGICGSDLHSFQDARIGDTPIQSPLILGHEFAGVVEAVGPESADGHFEPLRPGLRVAVDPAQPCGRCEFCEQGHPNLCRRLHFCGNYPDGGSFAEWIRMPARSCFPLPDGLDDEQGALLEPLGVAIHAVDLARLRVGNSVAILGAGPIGLLILAIARLAGADPIFVTDKFPWRLRLAEQWGGVPLPCEDGEPVRRIERETGGRGVDVAIEAAWADHSVAEAAELARLGGRLVLVGIPSDDRVELKHSTARRKGLTIRMSRRMKHVYPRALRLATQGRVDLKGLISHRFPLERAAEAFQLNTVYAEEVVKVMVES